MSANHPRTDSRDAADKSPRKRRGGKRARVRIDGRKALGRRVKELTAELQATLARNLARELTDVERIAAARAAERLAMAEHVAGEMIRGGTYTLHDYTRIERLADRSLAALGLSVPIARAKPQAATVSDPMARLREHLGHNS
jgi:hypothetical protein